MKVVLKTDEYTIFQRRDERHAIKDASKSWVNGEAKIAILLKHELVSAPTPKAPEPTPESEPETAAEVQAGEDAADSADSAAE